MRWKLPVAILLLILGIGLITINGWAREGASLAWKSISQTKSSAFPDRETPLDKEREPQSVASPWDGRIELTRAQMDALGIELATVEPQREPIRLEVNGSTAYDPDTLTQIRTRFESIVTRVHVTLGETIKKGDPLVDLESTDLAEAKAVFEETSAQLEHDKRQLERLTGLYKKKAIAEKDYHDAVNEEMQSRLEFKRARDKLQIFGLDENQIRAIQDEDGTQKARMTLRSPSDGIIIARNAVQDNLYDAGTVLLTIAPLTHLWVKGNVYESDEDRVEVGQSWEIRFPYLPGNNVVRATIEHIDQRVDPVTKTVQIRSSIPNLGGRLKADMLVRSAVLIPPVPDHTEVPRIAVVVADSDAYVFVRVSTHPSRFERREVEIVQELHDMVIISSGLSEGEMIATRGSLLLAQMFEDRAIAAATDSR